MKRKLGRGLRNTALIAVGVILGRGAQAATTIGDTTVVFDGTALPVGSQIPMNFASFQSPTNNPIGGVTFGSTGLGLGTPDIGLTWSFTSGGRGQLSTSFNYFTGGDNNWNAALLGNSASGHDHSITFTPGTYSLVQINSFNFTPYYNNSGEVFDYTITVKDANTQATLLSEPFTVTSGLAAKYPVTLDVTGDLDEPLTLDIARTGGTGGPFNIAADDFKFTEVVPEPDVPGLICLGLITWLGVAVWRRKSAS